MNLLLGNKREDYINPIQCFELFFGREVIDTFVEQSIIYYNQMLNIGKISKYKDSSSTYFILNKHGVNKQDILAFLGKIVFMGINKSNDRLGIATLIIFPRIYKHLKI